MVIGLFAGVAAADPKPQPIDIKPIRDQLQVAQDAKGGLYVFIHGKTSRLWYGTGKELYEQWVTGTVANGDAWQIDAWSPRLSRMQPGLLRRTEANTYERWCSDEIETAQLTLLTGDRAKQALDKHVLMTELLGRRPRFLARDESAVYYYVDQLVGGKGVRLFVGKKGAMKQVDLLDTAIDSAGSVYTAKTGELRLVDTHQGDAMTAAWVKGDKRTPLIWLDRDVNSHVIFSELGIYKQIGTLCDDL